MFLFLIVCHVFSFDCDNFQSLHSVNALTIDIRHVTLCTWHSAHRWSSIHQRWQQPTESLITDPVDAKSVFHVCSDYFHARQKTASHSPKNLCVVHFDCTEHWPKDLTDFDDFFFLPWIQSTAVLTARGTAWHSLWRSLKVLDNLSSAIFEDPESLCKMKN